MNPSKRDARTAGLLYFLIAVTAPVGLIYVPGRVIVPGDAMATADHLRAAEGLLRLGIASELLHQVLAIFLVLVLYRLFRPVHEHHARLLVILGALVSVPIMFLNVLNEMAALTLVSDAAYLSAFDPRQRAALALLFLRLHGQGIEVVSIFWGLWLFPFGILVMRSGFIPRILGVLLIVAGVAYLVSSWAALLVPAYAGTVSQIAMVFMFGELPIIFWLLIWGVKAPPPAST